MTLDPAEVSQPLQEWPDEGLRGFAGGAAQPTDAPDIPRLLRFGGRRRGEEAGSQRAVNRRLEDLIGEATYDRDGGDLTARGLFLDVPPCNASVFSLTRRA